MVWQYYRQHGRAFPWRQTDSPYHILVSELMLQQTQTSRVLTKYEELITAFPDFPALAEASLDQVLRVWQGLGYNRRALALHRIAGIVQSEFNGKLPASPEVLQKLPGIGDYTANAIAALAFNQPTVFIETNIRAVFLRCFFDRDEEVADRDILPLVAATLDSRQPRQWYYALFDYGAMLKKSGKHGARSRHYRRQSAFRGSNRELRARILRLVLARSPVPEQELIRQLDWSASQVRRNLEQMQKEGFISINGDSISIA